MLQIMSQTVAGHSQQRHLTAAARGRQAFVLPPPEPTGQVAARLLSIPRQRHVHKLNSPFTCTDQPAKHLLKGSYAGTQPTVLADIQKGQHEDLIRLLKRCGHSWRLLPLLLLLLSPQPCVSWSRYRLRRQVDIDDVSDQYVPWVKFGIDQLLDSVPQLGLHHFPSQFPSQLNNSHASRSCMPSCLHM